ncbi:Phosphate acyltransferase [Clostridium bornimense]|uniref:Phosphate acyltransferase n=1 Tax=Clostridium bornimense TaxID=1216932 RepID=W6SH97_9CLOT|nr:phosphate acyltransferase PlsX [Clostridium bornimense]CDM69055.1 Phosphate acyltransferase [Clostridium bornimense]
MIFVIDGMGGDNAPVDIVKGAVDAVKERTDLNLIITGKEDVIKKELSKYDYDKDRITIVHTEEVISNDESPTAAIRKKKDSSLVKGLQLVKSGEADGILSAGSTGAFISGSTLIVGRIKGVKRPALAPIMPGQNGPFMVVDVGGNVDCKPEFLKDFAMMGKVYYENVMGIQNPSIGLVNIGAEEEKGNELTKATYGLLKTMDINFVGNVEPREIPKGDVNVVVCDGFVGNTVLKMYEGVASTLLKGIKAEIISSTRGKIGGLLLKPIFKSFQKKYDYRETGGSPFLGVKGICVKAHGSSDAYAIKNGINQCIALYEGKVVDKIHKGINDNKEDSTDV